MDLPFSESAFLDLFGAYNQDLWAAVIAVWIITIAVVIRTWLKPRNDAAVVILLAAHWLWSGVVYHWIYFRTINSAAAIFAGLFVVQGALFAWAGLAHQGRFTAPRSLRGVVGLGLVGYGLIYPLMGIALGLQYPRLPLFAVPCPTALITAGLLLMSSGLPRVVNVVPILWTIIGSSAAIVLGIRADLALVAAGALLLLDTLAPRALGSR
ncbi:MAG: DUF6064 family protein [Vicinamibacterales bacterium]